MLPHIQTPIYIHPLNMRFKTLTNLIKTLTATTALIIHQTISTIINQHFQIRRDLINFLKIIMMHNMDITLDIVNTIHNICRIRILVRYLQQHQLLLQHLQPQTIINGIGINKSLQFQLLNFFIF